MTSPMPAVKAEIRVKLFFSTAVSTNLAISEKSKHGEHDRLPGSALFACAFLLHLIAKLNR